MLKLPVLPVMSVIAILQQLPTTRPGVFWNNVARSEKIYELHQGHSQRISGDIHRGVCVCLAVS